MFCVFIPYWKFNISKRIQPTSKIFTVLLLYKEGYRMIYFLILQLLNYERYFGLHSKKKVKCWKNLGKKIFFDSKINLLAQKKQTRYKAYVLWTSLVKSRQKTAHWDIFMNFLYWPVVKYTSVHTTRCYSSEDLHLVSTRFFSSVIVVIWHP